MDIARVQKNEAMLRGKLRAVGLDAVCQALGVSKSTVSRYQNERTHGKDEGSIDNDVAWVAAFLAALGCNAVPVELKCADPKTLETLIYGHRQWINSIQHPDELMWD